MLRERGLPAALKSLAERAALPIDISLHGKERHSEAVETCAYYVASEAVTNASKHANATQITIAIFEEPAWFRMNVTDDGAGGATPNPGGGLAGLMDRAAAIGGALSIHSVLGEGTALDLRLPISLETGSL
jgi:signal transduction histidine kinase